MDRRAVVMGDVLAIQFEEASLLTEEIIRKTIPAMVAAAHVNSFETLPHRIY
jgi:predicted PP-loop superfamily ATPase